MSMHIVQVLKVGFLVGICGCFSFSAALALVPDYYNSFLITIGCVSRNLMMLK